MNSRKLLVITALILALSSCQKIDISVRKKEQLNTISLLIQNEKIDSALIVVNKARMVFSEDITFKNQMDSLEKYIMLANNNNYLESILYGMKDNDIRCLNKDSLTIVFSNDYTVDRYFKNKLKEKLPSLKTIYDKKKKEAAEYERDRAIKRKLYGKTFREGLLDSYLNVKVDVYGVNNTIIELSYPLFDEVWTHNLAKNRTLSTFKELGFKKCIVTDGYNFSVYWNL